MRRLFALAIVVTCVSYSFAQDAAQTDGDVPSLIQALHHRDPQIRQPAANRLKEDSRDATAALAEALVDPASNQLHAARAATVLIDRLEMLRRDALAEETPRLKLTDKDREHLQPLISLVGQSQAEDWRWYLAVTVLDELQPSLLASQASPLMSALDGSNPMRQYAALRAIYHLRIVDGSFNRVPNGPRGRRRSTARGPLGTRLNEEVGSIPSASASEMKPALLDMLQRQRSALRGIYLRYNLAIEEDLLSHTSDVRVYYEDEVSEFQYEKRYRYYAHDDLLICDVLLAGGADFSDIGEHLISLSQSRNQSLQFHAATQLLQLGPQGQAGAAGTLTELVSDRQGSWLERLVEEHSSWAALRERDREAKAPDSFLAFQKLGDATVSVVPTVNLLLSSGDVRVRHCAAEILEHIGTTSKKEAMTALKEAIASEEILGGPALQAMYRAIAKIGLDQRSNP